MQDNELWERLKAMLDSPVPHLPDVVAEVLNFGGITNAADLHDLSASTQGANQMKRNALESIVHSLESMVGSVSGASPCPPRMPHNWRP